LKRRVFFGAGSNLGDRVAYLRLAFDTLPDVVKASSVYETEPVGGPDQPSFYNCVIEAYSELPASGLLSAAQACEKAASRVRTVRNGPRTLDVDVLLIEGEIVNEPDLIVPHPRMRERRFVLAPLQELAPDLVSESDLANAIGLVKLLGPLLELSSEK
jgi:2-amino-4-hydroxy-6-hydroxymethyldihydropteridine diphosphokinase